MNHNSLVKKTIEFNDNIISAYVVQKGMCYISKGKLIPNQCIAIRKEPHKERNRDSYTNIVIMQRNFANLIYQLNSNMNTIVEDLNLETEMKKKIVKLYNRHSNTLN